MILVDSSIWIEYLRGMETGQTVLLDSLLGYTPILIGDLIVAEVVQGVRDEKEFRQVKRLFDGFERVDIGGYDIAIKAAKNNRKLRATGYTIRKTIDTLIATRCIEDGLTLLHADRDFEPYARELGMREAFTAT